ncbi:hypothetical protein [Marinomonas ostreistagni]|uniref:hypothetical protein n=1 Tax=Marinomonas ostreistagni TaxID=359209 RepID=UPI001951FA93|nr:hypothetical protein [Marinomonas ostreistagni]MBM6550221.1 hypothetical protein [Marinomonas ostreistagni]
MRSTDIQFGTSGARGLVAHWRNDVVAAYTLAFVQTLQQQGIQLDRLALGIDRRPSSPCMAAVIAGVLQACGIEVDYFGILPTPALALHAMKQGSPAIMVTGSHIPYDRNGLKFYRPDGEIDKHDEALLCSQQGNIPDYKPFLPATDDRALETYFQRYTRPFTPSVLKGWRIGLYQHSAAGREVSLRILQTLGATVICLGASETFVALDTERFACRSATCEILG